MESSNLVLLAKMATATPQILDGENQLLQRKVGALYIGLLLTGRFTPAHQPVALTGAMHNGESICARSSTIDGPTGLKFGGYPSITAPEVRTRRHSW